MPDVRKYFSGLWNVKSNIIRFQTCVQNVSTIVIRGDVIRQRFVKTSFFERFWNEKWLINAKIQKITYLSVWKKFLPELRTLIPQNYSTNIWTFEWNPICVFITSRSKVTLWNRNTSCLMADCSELPNITCVQEFFNCMAWNCLRNGWE